jgi:hypothetical protein
MISRFLSHNGSHFQFVGKNHVSLTHAFGSLLLILLTNRPWSRTKCSLPKDQLLTWPCLI